MTVGRPPPGVEGLGCSVWIVFVGWGEDVGGRVGTLLSAWTDVTNSVAVKIAKANAWIFMVRSRC
jgi:hypothetical protein